MENDHYPRVGIGVFVMKDGKVLLGKRLGSHGAGEYAALGGYLEHLESFEECARRETREEAGIEIGNVRLVYLFNNKTYNPKHFAEVGVLADWVSGEPAVMEPDKRESWEWFDPDHLPTPLFSSIPVFAEAYKTGRIYFDA